MFYAQSCYRCGEVYADRGGTAIRRHCERCGADLMVLNQFRTWRQLRRLGRALRGRQGGNADIGEPSDYL